MTLPSFKLRWGGYKSVYYWLKTSIVVSKRRPRIPNPTSVVFMGLIL